MKRGQMDGYWDSMKASAQRANALKILTFHFVQSICMKQKKLQSQTKALFERKKKMYKGKLKPCLKKQKYVQS